MSQQSILGNFDKVDFETFAANNKKPDNNSLDEDNEDTNVLDLYIEKQAQTDSDYTALINEDQLKGDQM
jgi:hypothetical protein